MRALIFSTIAALLVLITPAVAATDFSISISAPDSFLVGATDTATVSIFNNGTAGWFTITLLGIESWAWTPTSRLQIGQGDTGNVTVHVSPPMSADPKIYSFLVTVGREATGEEMERQLLVQVRQTVDARLANLTTSCAQCAGSVEFSVDVQNIGTEPFTGTLAANLAGIPRSYPLEIARGGVQRVTDSLDLTGYSPGDYRIALNLSSLTRQIQAAGTNFSITAVGNVVYNRTASSSPFGNSVVLTATNLGNVPQTATIHSTVARAWWSAYSGPAPTQVTETEYVWVTELAGGGSMVIAYSEVFWPLPIIIIALIIVGIVAYFQKAALTVKKAAVGRTIIIPGRDIGIALTIKNTRRTAESITVRELIPAAFSVGGRFDTLKPVMRKTHVGTELIWKFNNVGPGEERMIHYKITPNVQVYGGTVLSPAIVRAKCGSRVIERASNSLVLQGATGGARRLPVEVEK